EVYDNRNRRSHRGDCTLKISIRQGLSVRDELKVHLAFRSFHRSFCDPDTDFPGAFTSKPDVVRKSVPGGATISDLVSQLIDVHGGFNSVHIKQGDDRTEPVAGIPIAERHAARRIRYFGKLIKQFGYLGFQNRVGHYDPANPLIY